ncbi:DUF2189 domain-containing protein [Rhizobium sp. RU20A]|uniref:DUF2189 domain-containing protein n=1 Tax=Rhizobium sp. RU20A TaxID=1907412 RepID=UPI001FCEBF31|nr:DUF2189 domain-containing protein [Rhizobium sp. RU20A]
MPDVRAVTAADIGSALAAGLADFRRAPAFGLFFGAVYAMGGLIIALSLALWHVPWLIYPCAIGFPLIGPFIAVGLYEVSRRLERGETLSWPGVLGFVWAQRRRELGWMAFVMLFIFWVWMYQIRLLIALVLGRLSFSTLPKFVDIVLTTPEGWLFLVLGHIVGAVLALILFSLTVVSVPLLMERDLDIVTAMATSVRAVLASPVPMLGWGVVVTLLVLAGAASAFIGLVVVLPVLGHATWHLYRAIIPPA